MRLTHIIAIFASCLLLVACGGSSDSASVKVTVDGKKLETGKGAIKTDLVASELLTAEMVAAAFGLSSDQVEVNTVMKDQKYTSYKWDKPDQEGILARNRELMDEFQRKRMEALQKGEPDPKFKIIDSEAHVSFNYMAMNNADAAERAFGANIENLRKGITGEAQGVKATFRIDYDQEVEGVGSQAVWSSSKKQLMTQHKNLMLYLNLKVSDNHEDDLAKAKELMGKITAKL